MFYWSNSCIHDYTPLPGNCMTGPSQTVLEYRCVLGSGLFQKYLSYFSQPKSICALLTQKDWVFRTCTTAKCGCFKLCIYVFFMYCIIIISNLNVKYPAPYLLNMLKTFEIHIVLIALLQYRNTLLNIGQSIHSDIGSRSTVNCSLDMDMPNVVNKQD